MAQKTLRAYLRSRYSDNYYAKVNRWRKNISLAEIALSGNEFKTAPQWANWAQHIGFAILAVIQSRRPEETERIIGSKAEWMAELVMRCSRKAFERCKDNLEHGIKMHQDVAILPALRWSRYAIGQYEGWKIDRAKHYQLTGKTETDKTQ